MGIYRCHRRPGNRTLCATDLLDRATTHRRSCQNGSTDAITSDDSQGHRANPSARSLVLNTLENAWGRIASISAGILPPIGVMEGNSRNKMGAPCDSFRSDRAPSSLARRFLLSKLVTTRFLTARRGNLNSYEYEEGGVTFF